MRKSDKDKAWINAIVAEQKQCQIIAIVCGVGLGLFLLWFILLMLYAMVA